VAGARVARHADARRWAVRVHAARRRPAGPPQPGAGPPEPLYFNGSRLDAVFPLSLLLHGNALNITCVSYAGTLNFGFTGARETLPHLQRLAIYMGESLEEISAILLPEARDAAVAAADPHAATTG
jgi:diacylglycerol O-acyltransferase / wax synthase